MTTTRAQSDLIESISAALRYISDDHPADDITHLAKTYELEQSLMDDLDMHEPQAMKTSGEELTSLEALRIELHDKVNTLGIGAQGLGGVAAVLDVKIKMCPTHAASKPVARIPNGAATRMDGFVETMLAQTGLIAMIGKGERGPIAIEAINRHRSASLMASGELKTITLEPA